MKYTELKKQIKAASKMCQQDGITAYISNNENDQTISNFLINSPSFDQICRAEDEGLLVRDWDTWEVI